jgi:hypothetical protein
VFRRWKVIVIYKVKKFQDQLNFVARKHIFRPERCIVNFLPSKRKLWVFRLSPFPKEQQQKVGFISVTFTGHHNCPGTR